MKRRSPRVRSRSVVHLKLVCNTLFRHCTSSFGKPLREFNLIPLLSVAQLSFWIGSSTRSCTCHSGHWLLKRHSSLMVIHVASIITAQEAVGALSAFALLMIATGRLTACQIPERFHRFAEKRGSEQWRIGLQRYPNEWLTQEITSACGSCGSAYLSKQSRAPRFHSEKRFAWTQSPHW